MSCKCHRKVMEFGYGIMCESYNISSGVYGSDEAVKSLCFITVFKYGFSYNPFLRENGKIMMSEWQQNNPKLPKINFVMISSWVHNDQKKVVWKG